MVCTSLTVLDQQPAQFELTVNGQKGSITVYQNATVNLRTQGGDPNDDRKIVNISEDPDIVLCQGSSDNLGIFQCSVKFTEPGQFKIKGYEDCALGICIRETNEVIINVQKLITGFELLANNQKGNIHIDVGETVTLRTQGGDPNDDRMIVDISTEPDIVLCQGTSDNTGVFACQATFNEEKIFQIRGYEDCAAGICLRETNTITISVGEAKSPDNTTTAIIIAGGLAAAYIIGQAIKGR